MVPSRSTRPNLVFVPPISIPNATFFIVWKNRFIVNSYPCKIQYFRFGDKKTFADTRALPESGALARLLTYSRAADERMNRQGKRAASPA